MTRFVVGFFAPWLIYLTLLVVHLIVPSRRVEGYVTDPETGVPLQYRLNGLPVLLVSVAVWALLGKTGVVSYNWLYLNRWAGLAGAATLGLLASLAVVVTAPKTRPTFLGDFFFGRRLNPKFLGGRVDAKMFLYLVGATLLALNILSFTAHHIMRYGSEFSVSVVLYSGLFVWFLIDYMTFERVHLYTYDLFAERVGFKLTWGCITFYPYFYAIGLWFVADRPSPGTPAWLLVLYAALFFSGWILARGANMQKFRFKTDPDKTFLGIIEPRTISDQSHSLLCSGFWGVSRHVNYLGEILMATGLTLALGYPLVGWAWLYPLYYIALLFTRERADDRRCKAKYGPLWDQYVERVPRRIVPGIY